MQVSNASVKISSQNQNLQDQKRSEQGKIKISKFKTKFGRQIILSNGGLHMRDPIGQNTKNGNSKLKTRNLAK